MKTLVFILYFLSLHSFAKYPDLIFCEKASLNSLEGYYSPDYLLTKNENDIFIDDSNLKFYDWFLYLSQLQLPELALRMEYFRQDLFKPYHLGQMNIWEDGEQGFPALTDYSDKKKLPDNCRNPAIQVIESSLTPTANLYEFDSKILYQVQNKSDLQYSFVLLRTFLSQFSDDDNLIREINYQLHLKSTFTNLHLKNRFIKLLKSTKIEKSFCERSFSIVEALEKELNTSCQNMSGNEISKIEKIKIQDINRDETIYKNFSFRKNDFSYLSNLKELDISNLSWFGTSIIPFMFSQLHSLETINLSRTSIYLLSNSIFEGLKNLKNLDLTAAKIDNMSVAPLKNIFGPHSTLNLSRLIYKSLGASELMGLENLETLILNNTFISTYNDNAFQSLKNLKVLDVSHHQDFNYGNNLDEKFLPKIEKIIAKNNHGVIKQIQSLPTLKELDLSQTFFTNEQTALLKKMPHLEKLDLSQTNFQLPNDTDDLNKLKFLKHLALMDLHSVTGSDQMLMIKLPNSLEMLDICYKNIGIGFWKNNFRELVKNQPKLKIRTKNNCQGDWIEITY